MKSPDYTVNCVCDDLYKRSVLGLQKYGCTTYDNNLDLLEWLNHAYEEMLDQAVYIKRAIIEIERSKDDGR